MVLIQELFNIFAHLHIWGTKHVLEITSDNFMSLPWRVTSVFTFDTLLIQSREPTTRLLLK